MKDDMPALPQPRVITDPALVARLLEHTAVKWPANLYRFAPFKRDRDGDQVIYRSVTWNADDRSMYVLRIISTATPTGTGEWLRWRADSDDRPLDDVRKVEDIITPQEMRDLSVEIRPSSLVGFQRRNSILQAFSFVTVLGSGEPQLVFNPFVLSDQAERSAALEHVYSTMGQPAGYQSYVLELFHKYAHFGGAPRALAKLTSRQGGPGQTRVGVNVRRPGPKSAPEERAEARQAITGASPPCRRGPVRLADIEKFVTALQKFFVEEKLSYASTYSRMVAMLYAKYPARLIPSFNTFLYHARTRLVEKNDSERKRSGRRLTAQYATARAGQASHLTFGLNVETVDVDGFVAKIPIAARIGGVIEPVHVTVLFAVSRRSGAVVGYEIAMRGENAEAFRRCIASIYLPKAKRAKELGLVSTKGLLHGTIDAIFVDNGAGASEEVLATACIEMLLMRMVAPPARGDLKAVGENLNGLMVLLLSELAAGYTRKTDIFSKELRRIKSKDAPLTLEQFETFLLMAIQHINLFSNKRHLRSETMRREGIGLKPASIWGWYQRRSLADQARKWEPLEVWQRFIPWTTKHVRSGKVKFLQKRWTSPELEEVYKAHMRRPAKTRPPLVVKIKRIGAHATELLWQRPDGSTGALGMVEEDRLMLGVMTWKALELRNADDDELEKKDAPKAHRSRNRIKHSQQVKVDKAERNRADLGYGGFEGETIKDARQNAHVARDADRVAGMEVGATQAFPGVLAEEMSLIVAESIVDADGVDDEESYVDSLSARLQALAASAVHKTSP
ncbi:hypothetical protein PQQ81_32335 [Paraburkholderia strydomiana]|uniref:hypothetical protein n=1 Tax=Paraburkholderia strydomiana TaxID=1245417 RepID=UPI0038BBE48C